MTVALTPLAVRALTLAWLAVVWVALWGAPTAGTATAGALLAAAVLAGGSRRRAGGGTLHVRPFAVTHLASVFAVMLVRSTVEVVRLVLTRRLALESAVITVVLPTASTGIATLVANAVTLTPGTLTLDAQSQPEGTTLLVVHALHAPDAEAVRRDVLRLYTLASAAIGRPAAVLDDMRSCP